MNAQAGFSLIEIILVIVILSVASVPLFSLFNQAGLNILNNETLQTATQLAQERAEHLMAVRRNQGYTATDISADHVEKLGGNYSGFTRTTSINKPYTGSDCPVSAACKQINISVADSTQTRANIVFTLVDY